MSFQVSDLDERARKLGYQVERSELIGHPFNFGQGEWCRVFKDGEPVFKFSWRAEEVAMWLRLKENGA